MSWRRGGREEEGVIRGVPLVNAEAEEDGVGHLDEDVVDGVGGDPLDARVLPVLEDALTNEGTPDTTVTVGRLHDLDEGRKKRQGGGGRRDGETRGRGGG